ncbi:MAG: hypothetical protein RLY93_12125, partial [Sumerlaeia bacterium]
MRNQLLPIALAACSLSLAPQAHAACTASTLTPLADASGCDSCGGFLLPGSLHDDPNTTYYINSDLPEQFQGTGILYSTEDQLPPNGTSSSSLRTQTKNGFTYIDDNFDIFLFHIEGQGGSQGKRMVVYAKNVGSNTVTVDPKQVMVTDGIILAVHEMENDLAEKVMNDDWDTPVSSMNIAPGQGNVIAYSKRFDMSSSGTDKSQNINCFGRVRADVSGSNPKLEVYVMAIDDAAISENQSRAEALLNSGATNDESVIDLNTAPGSCETRRALGVFPSKQWRNDAITVDVNELGMDGVNFRMALSEVQSAGCSAGRQTADALLYPGFAPADNVGNYMMDYYLKLKFTNLNSANPRTFDLNFGKDTADIGLAWRVVTTNSQPSDSTIDNATLRIDWAGPKQSTNHVSFLENDGGVITLEPCEEKWVGIHFQIVGNS